MWTGSSGTECIISTNSSPITYAGLPSNRSPKWNTRPQQKPLWSAQSPDAMAAQNWSTHMIPTSDTHVSIIIPLLKGWTGFDVRGQLQTRGVQINSLVPSSIHSTNSLYLNPKPTFLGWGQLEVEWGRYRLCLCPQGLCFITAILPLKQITMQSITIKWVWLLIPKASLMGNSSQDFVPYLHNPQNFMGLNISLLFPPAILK